MEIQSPGVLMLDLVGQELASAEQEVLQRASVGGVILFTRNYRDPIQLKELVQSIRECDRNLLIAVDQEGGRVQRFREGFQPLPALHEIGKVYQQDKRRGRDLARTCAWGMAAEILHYGIDISFAPVLDLYTKASNVIKERAFASDVESVVDLARHYVDGMREAGMASTGKHFPGHGTVVADSHVELPVDERSAEEIMEQDCQVFAQCIDQLDGIMPAHVKYPALDENCAGYSKFWIQEILRNKLGFDGVVFSDDLTMKAAHIVGNVENRAQLALEAGCDMVLVCNDPEAALQASDWLEQQSHPGSSRINTMRAKPAAEIENLYEQEKWADACRALDSLLS